MLRQGKLRFREPIMMNRRVLLALAAIALGAQLFRSAPAGAQRPPPSARRPSPGTPRPTGARSAVRVTREAPVVVRESFDPRRPPPDMPPLTPPEAGVCKITFALDAGVNFTAEQLSSTTARIYVEEIEIVTRVRFDIFTAVNGPAKLSAHEEGHRAIGEHYYDGAAEIAESIGRRLVGKTYDGAGANLEAAQRDAFNKVVAEIELAYMARVRTPSAAANERFDEITNHGLDPIDEAEAVALAIAGAAPP